MRGSRVAAEAAARGARCRRGRCEERAAAEDRARPPRLPWVKFGSTDCSNPWKRARRGFWSNSHPPAVCRKLGYDDLELLAWSHGGTRQAEEAAQKELRAAKADGHGEFWPIERVDEIRAKMKAIAVGAGAPEDSWELPPIPKPAQPPDGTQRLLEKLGCCTGQPKLQCPHCPYQAARQHHMNQHLAES